MQESWDIGFEHLIYILDVLCTLYNLAPPGAAEKSATWGDGVLEDTEKSSKGGGLWFWPESISWRNSTPGILDVRRMMQKN